MQPELAALFFSYITKSGKKSVLGTMRDGGDEACKACRSCRSYKSYRSNKSYKSYKSYRSDKSYKFYMSDKSYNPVSLISPIGLGPIGLMGLIGF